jgi:hypothetical protein
VSRRKRPILLPPERGPLLPRGRWSLLPRKRSIPLVRSAVAVGAALSAGALALGQLPASASAAPTTPPSTTQCSGTIRLDAGGPAAGNPNPYDYTFACLSSIAPGATDPSGYSWNFSGNIWSYTIIVTRRRDNGSNVSYDAPTANVLAGSGALDTTQYVNCSSAVPSDGFSCSAPGPGASSASDFANGTNPPYSAYIPAGETVTGGFALAEGYCGFLPKGARPGTPAVPQATVQLIVTDTNGVSAGPFELFHAGKKCPKVPAVVPGAKVKRAAS